MWTEARLERDRERGRREERLRPTGQKDEKLRFFLIHASIKKEFIYTVPRSFTSIADTNTKRLRLKDSDVEEKNPPKGVPMQLLGCTCNFAKEINRRKGDVHTQEVPLHDQLSLHRASLHATSSSHCAGTHGQTDRQTDLSLSLSPEHLSYVCTQKRNERFPDLPEQSVQSAGRWTSREVLLLPQTPSPLFLFSTLLEAVRNLERTDTKEPLLQRKHGSTTHACREKHIRAGSTQTHIFVDTGIYREIFPVFSYRSHDTIRREKKKPGRRRSERALKQYLTGVEIEHEEESQKEKRALATPSLCFAQKLLTSFPHFRFFRFSLVLLALGSCVYTADETNERSRV